MAVRIIIGDFGEAHEVGGGVVRRGEVTLLALDCRLNGRGRLRLMDELLTDEELNEWARGSEGNPVFGRAPLRVAG